MSSIRRVKLNGEYLGSFVHICAFFLELVYFLESEIPSLTENDVIEIGYGDMDGDYYKPNMQDFLLFAKLHSNNLSKQIMDHYADISTEGWDRIDFIVEDIRGSLHAFMNPTVHRHQTVEAIE